jgi:hypothetical protein
MRPEMPEDQLIRAVTADAVEQGLNNDWDDNGSMAAYIAGLVPTIDTNVNRTAPAAPGAAPQDAAPEVDTTAAAAQQLSKFQTAYGQGKGPDGLPSQFYQLFLGPVVDGDLASATAQKLSDELAGEIPAAPARIIAGRLETAHGDAAQMKQDADSIRDDTDPDLQDQVRALDILAPLLQKLKQAAERNESVELNRIKMLAGM